MNGLGKPVRSNLTKLTEETIRAKTKSGDTPLHRAAKNGQFDLVPRHLLSLELFLMANNAGDTPLHLAARRGYLNQVPVEFLTRKTLTCRTSPPYAPNGTYVTDSGKKVLTKTVLHAAACYKHIDQIPRQFLTPPYLGLIATGRGTTLLEDIFENGQLDLIPDINSNKEIWRLRNGYGQTLHEVIEADRAAKEMREAYIAMARSEPITAKQRVKLQWFGYPVRKGMTKGEAHDAIDECIRQNPEKEKEYQNRPATGEQMTQLRIHAKGDKDLAEMLKEMDEEGSTLTYGEAKELLPYPTPEMLIAEMRASGQYPWLENSLLDSERNAHDGVGKRRVTLSFMLLIALLSLLAWLLLR